MSICITEYGEVAAANLTETGQHIGILVSELGEVVFNGYVEPTLQQVADSLSSADSILRHKPSARVTDSLQATDYPLNHKPLSKLSDGASLSDTLATPTRTLQTLDTVSILDTTKVTKLLILSDDAALVETAERVVHGELKTKLFLILADLAIQITGN